MYFEPLPCCDVWEQMHTFWAGVAIAPINPLRFDNIDPSKKCLTRSSKVKLADCAGLRLQAMCHVTLTALQSGMRIGTCHSEGLLEASSERDQTYRRQAVDLRLECHDARALLLDCLRCNLAVLLLQNLLLLQGGIAGRQDIADLLGGGCKALGYARLRGIDELMRSLKRPGSGRCCRCGCRGSLLKRLRLRHCTLISSGSGHCCWSACRADLLKRLRLRHFTPISSGYGRCCLSA